MPAKKQKDDRWKSRYQDALTAEQEEHIRWIQASVEDGTLTAESFRAHWNDFHATNDADHRDFRAIFFYSIKTLEDAGEYIPKSWLSRDRDSLLMDCLKTCHHFASLWAGHCRAQGDPMTQYDWGASGIAENLNPQTMTVNNEDVNRVFVSEYWSRSGTAEDAIIIYNAMDAVPEGAAVHEQTTRAAAEVIATMLAKERHDSEDLAELLEIMPDKLREEIPNLHQLRASALQTQNSHRKGRSS